ncbi:MAG: CRTAC1 family protein [Acidobacteriota bacterium]
MARYLAAFMVPLLFLSLQQVGPNGNLIIKIPLDDIGIKTLQNRHDAQLRTVEQFEVFHGFRFSDRIEESGIGFRHHVTDDSSKRYRPNHYDHGNSVAAADVDGDGLHDVYFVSQIGTNELWRNLGNGRFENITEGAGVGLGDRISVAASFADIDNDGDPDLFVTTVKMGNVLFENDGKGHFNDISSAAGVDHIGHSSGAVFFDFDTDGLLDLFVTNVGAYTSEERGPGGYFLGLENAFQGHLMPERSERSILYRNMGSKRFRDVTEELGLVDESWSGDASFTDLNSDGLPDLYVVNMQGDDHYYEQTGERFIDRTAAYFPKTPWGTMGIKFFDHDNDGLMDLMLTDMHSDMMRSFLPNEEKIKVVVTNREAAERIMPGLDNNILGNAFYRNLGDGQFTEISDDNGTENYWPWGLSVGDLNADGYEDVLIASSMNFPYRYGINSVLLNNRGKRFLDAEFILGVEPRKNGRTDTVWFALDCSGADKGHFYCQDESGTVTIMANPGTRSSVLFDLDDDGDLDIVTNEFNSEPQVLVSNLGERADFHYLKVKLVGTSSNRDGLGATVKVTAGPSTLSRYHDGKSGYLTHSSLPLYFGLGDTATVDRIEVRWPSGKLQAVEGPIGVDRTLEIVEEPAS